MPSLSWKRYLERASKAYHEQLLEANRDVSLPVGARNYFREHAIDPRIALKYRLGYVGKPLPGDEQFTGMISVPYLAPAGVQIIKYRNWAPGGGKYAQYSGQKGRLFNTNAYFDAGETIGIAEGETDPMAATEHLGIPTVGAPGATSWNELWTPLFKDFSRVLVFGDGDAEDSEAWSFPLKVAELIGWRARVIRCPRGEDVSSMCATGRTSELLALVTTSNGEEE